MIDWVYANGISCVDIPQKNGIQAIGFVYLITINGSEYIGSKRYTKRRKRHFGKKEKALLTDKRKKTWEYVYTESDWKTYCSSSDVIKALLVQGHVPERKILRVCYSLKELSFFENKYIYEIICEDNCLNENVSGNYFKKEIDEWTT